MKNLKFTRSLNLEEIIKKFAARKPNESYLLLKAKMSTLDFSSL